MNRNWKRLAPVGLYLTLVALLAAGVIYVLQREFNLWMKISLGVAVLGLALFATLDPERVRRMFTGRQAKYGSNTLLATLAFLAIVVVVNVLVYNNSKRWDLTEDRTNTLSSESLETLSRLPDKVEVTGFFTARINSDSARTLLDQYKVNSGGNLDYRFIDPEADPITAQQMEIDRDGTLVFKMGEKVDRVTSANEQEITSALVRLISTEQVSIYFMTGHGERSIDATEDGGLSQLKTTLESRNYSVKQLNLLVEGKVPEDARLIVIPSPQKPVSSQEVALLKAYLEQGGNLFVTEEPIPVTSFGDSPDPLAEYLTQEWGVTLGNDIVVDLTSQQPLVALAYEYAEHPVTQKFQNMFTFFPSARSVRLDTENTSVTGVELIKTADRSWGETDYDGVQGENAQVSADPAKDLIGPVSLAVIAEKLLPAQRLVVIGDVDFATNAYIREYGNRDLFVNAVDWAAQREEIIDLTPKETTERLLLPPKRYTMGLILLFSICLLPGGVMAAGVFAFVQKRRRG